MDSDNCQVYKNLKLKLFHKVGTRRKNARSSPGFHSLVEVNQAIFSLVFIVFNFIPYDATGLLVRLKKIEFSSLI